MNDVRNEVRSREDCSGSRVLNATDSKNWNEQLFDWPRPEKLVGINRPSDRVDGLSII